MAGKKTEPVRTLTEAAVDTIRNRILDLTLAAGTRVDAPLLMKQFKLSRTPAREALNRLAAEGLIVMHPNRGAYVRTLDFDDLQALFDIYFVEERMIGHFCGFEDPELVADLEALHKDHQLATRARRYLDITRVNSEFHVRIARSSGNDYVHEFAYRIHNHFRRLSFRIYALESRLAGVLEGQMKHIIDEHGQIIRAIRRRDRALLGDVLTAHARRARDRFIAAIEASRGDSFDIPPVAAAEWPIRGSRHTPA